MKRGYNVSMRGMASAYIYVKPIYNNMLYSFNIQPSNNSL